MHSKMVLHFLTTVGLASALPLSDFQDDADESLNLLQFSAARHNVSNALATESEGPLNAHCSLQGDVHIMKSFYLGKQDHHKWGVFEIVQSLDGRFNVQTYQCPAHQYQVSNGVLQAFAMDLDGTRIVVTIPTRDDIEAAWDFNGKKWITDNEYWQKGKLRQINIVAAGVTYTAKDLPLTIPGTEIQIRNVGSDWKFEIKTDGFRAEIEQTVYCNYGFPYGYYNFKLWMESSNLQPYAGSNAICTTGAAADHLAADKPILFSNDDLHAICDWCKAGIDDYKSGENRFHGGLGREIVWKRNPAKGGAATLDKFECSMPPDPPPPPPAKAFCEEHGCAYEHGQDVCSSLKGDGALFEQCLFDYCLDCDDHVAEDFVASEEDDNPKPICVQGAAECAPDEVCTKSVKMNTLTVSQNNLGGVGPDDGAEEIRYSKAAVVNGRAVDLVVTAEGTFTTSKASANGKSGAFGKINVKCGTAVTVKMKVVDAETGAPVTLEQVAVSWYDLDEGKKGKGRATVQTCGSTGAIVSENTELTVERKGSCSTATSSVAGTGKDNPKNPFQLDNTQIARTLTLPFKGVSEWTSTLSLAKGHKGRNFLFAIEPAVACGLQSD